MNVLFACHRLPYPPKRGGKIRPFNIIKHLKEQGHSVTVGSIARSDEEREEGAGLKEYCDKLHVGQVGQVGAGLRMVARLPTTVPSSMGYFYSASLHREMESEVKSGRYDLAFVHCSSAAQYLGSNKSIPSIIDFGDMDSHKWLDYSSYKPMPLSAGYWLEGKKLYRAEQKLARKFDLSTCTTRAELESLRAMQAASSSSWFPNGVDAGFFCPTDQPYDPDGICFIGRMDYYPNQQGMLFFCQQVMPLIREKNERATLTIIGANPSREIEGLASLPGVTVTGTVDDVRPYVRRAAVSVAPLAIARGTQNKILEAMAMGVPVVCSETAAGGVDVEPGVHIRTATTPAEYAGQVLAVLGDAEERQRLSESGRARVLGHHNWAASMQKLDGIIASVIGER